MTFLLALATPAVAIMLPYPSGGSPPAETHLTGRPESVTVAPLFAIAVPPAPEKLGLEFHTVMVSGYASDSTQTDSTPNVTATNDNVRRGTLALSRDLLRTFTPGAPFDFGDWVLISGVGVFVVEDTMHPRWRSCADIWFPDRKQAIRWGRRRAQLSRLQVRPAKWNSIMLGPLGWSRL